MARPPTAEMTRWLRVFLPRPAATLRLVCFPQAGGAASVFHDWARRLPPSVELLAVQYPGRQDRAAESPVATLEDLAAQVAVALEPRFDRPVAFFGHSLGATVAFETARRLRPRFPTPLTRLVVSARKAPADCGPSGYDFHRDADLRRYLARVGGLAALALRDEELWQVAVPALRADLLMSERYRFRVGAPLTCPLTVIAATEDHSCPVETMRGWFGHTIGDVDEHTVPGDHYYVNNPPPALFTVLSGMARRG